MSSSVSIDVVLVIVLLTCCLLSLNQCEASSDQLQLSNLPNHEKQETRIGPNQIQIITTLNQLKSSIESIVKNLNKTMDRVVLLHPRDCCDLRKAGIRETGSYEIRIKNTLIEVRCDMDTDGGGWTVIQRRTLNGLRVKFTRRWVEYEEGFGKVPQSYWIGLKNIAELTRNRDQEIRFDMEAFNVLKGKAYAKYGHFYVSGPEDKYRLRIANYSGTAGDSMQIVGKGKLNGMQFSTADNDNDKSSGNCAEMWKSGWWYNACDWAHPNGMLFSTEIDDDSAVYWWTFHSYKSLKFMEMKIRNKNPALCGV